MKTIILHSQDLALAQNLSSNLNGELEQRKNHFRIHTKLSFNLEQLRQSNRADLNLFKDGVYLTSDKDHEPFGIYWESLHPLCRWGGRFKDGNHYSIEHQGVK